MKIKQFKNKNGITLIALVVTIIILIILAGISINLVLGENGIIKRAQQARDEYADAQKEEQEILNALENLVENEGKVVIKGPVEGGSYDNPYIPTGFTHTEGEGTWNNGYVIREVETGNEFVWVPCVTDESKIKIGDNVEIFKKMTESRYNEYSLNLSQTDEEPTEAIRTSVGMYGGFYIARYEAGVPLDKDGNEIAVASATTSQKARSVSGATVWTNITRINAITVAANMVNTEDGVKSGLISGEGWDTTLQWIVNTSDNASDNAKYDIDSTGKGYYEQTDKTTTGQYQINNIYDMAGNTNDWTTENCTHNNNSYLVSRGGNFNDSGLSHPAASRNVLNENPDNIGFRVALYK